MGWWAWFGIQAPIGWAVWILEQRKTQQTGTRGHLDSTKPMAYSSSPATLKVSWCHLQPLELLIFRNLVLPQSEKDCKISREDNFLLKLHIRTYQCLESWNHVVLTQEFWRGNQVSFWLLCKCYGVAAILDVLHGGELLYLRIWHDHSVRSAHVIVIV